MMGVQGGSPLERETVYLETVKKGWWINPMLWYQALKISNDFFLNPEKNAVSIKITTP